LCIAFVGQGDVDGVCHGVEAFRVMCWFYYLMWMFGMQVVMIVGLVDSCGFRGGCWGCAGFVT
jgi:hypothetical protein